MYDEYIMVNEFGDHVLDMKITQPYPSHVKGIFLLNDVHCVLRSNYVYICSPEFFEGFYPGTMSGTPPVFFLTAGKKLDLQKYQGVSIISTDLDVIELYNRFQGLLWDMNNWVQRMHQVIYGSKSLQEMLNIASEKIVKASILVFNNSYFLLAHTKSIESNHFVDSVIRSNRYNAEEDSDFDNDVPFFMYEGRFLKEYNAKFSNNFCIDIHPTCEGYMTCRLWVVTDSPELNHYYTALCCLLAENLEKFFRNNHDISIGNNIEFSSFISDLISGRLTDITEIEKRRSGINLKVNNPFRLILIETENPASVTIPTLYMTHSALVKNLQQMIPASDITTYKGYVIILCNNKNPAFNDDQLTVFSNMMIRYNYYMCIGGYSDSFQSISALFYQAKTAIRLSKKIDTDCHIINAEDYSVLELIELSYHSLTHYLKTQDPFYLCSSGFKTLKHYDEKHKSNYVETIATYLKNDCNSTESARQLFVHRNTLIKKVSRAEEIMGESLDSSAVKQRFLLSYSIYEYSIKYLDNVINDIADK